MKMKNIPHSLPHLPNDIAQLLLVFLRCSWFPCWASKMLKETIAEYCFNWCNFIAQVNQMDDVFSIQDPHFWALSRFVLHMYFSYLEEDTLFMCQVLI